MNDKRVYPMDELIANIRSFGHGKEYFDRIRFAQKAKKEIEREVRKPAITSARNRNQASVLSQIKSDLKQY